MILTAKKAESFLLICTLHSGIRTDSGLFWLTNLKLSHSEQKCQQFNLPAIPGSGLEAITWEIKDGMRLYWMKWEKNNIRWNGLRWDVVSWDTYIHSVLLNIGWDHIVWNEINDIGYQMRW